MFIEGAKNDDTVLMSLKGNFDLDEIAVLTNKMKIPGGDDLRKATKAKNKMKTVYGIMLLSLFLSSCNSEPSLQKILC
jgi:hypothetical protein